MFAICFTEPPIGVAPNADFPSMRLVIAVSIAAEVISSSSAGLLGGLAATAVPLLWCRNPRGVSAALGVTGFTKPWVVITSREATINLTAILDVESTLEP